MRRLGIIAAVLVALLAVFWGALAHYEQVVRPANLRAAGVIRLEPLTTEVSIDTVLPPAPGGENAAAYYVTALNSYNTRRLPYLHNRALNPFADEPPLDPLERAALMVGAQQKECDFYALEDDRPRFTFLIYPGGKRWPFDVARDPYAIRPYVSLVRLLAQAALNAAKGQERLNHRPEAEALYQAILRLGFHLHSHPGSILDVQLGLEMEQKGLHYLDAFYGLIHDTRRRKQVWCYGDAVSRLVVEVERKFTQLGNPEAAKQILLHDRERVWRIEAAAALEDTLQIASPGWFEARSIRHALGAARHDPDRAVRKAVYYLADRPRPKPVTKADLGVEGEASKQ